MNYTSRAGRKGININLTNSQSSLKEKVKESKKLKKGRNDERMKEGGKREKGRR